MKFGFIPVASEFLDTDSMNILIKDYNAKLTDLGGIRLNTGQIHEPMPLFFFLVTGGTENATLELKAKRQELLPDEPVFLIAHPTNNSLPACLEVLAKLQQDGIPGRIFYLNGAKDVEGFESITKILEDVEIFNSMRDSRIGVLGVPSDWLVASKPSPEIVRKAWGAQLINIDFEEVWTELKNISNDSLINHKAAVQDEAIEIIEPTKKDLDESVKIYLAFKTIVEKYKLDGITVRCFDLVKGMDSTGCFGLAELNDEGIIAGCEGDIVSTIAMLWIGKMLNKASWMANPSQVDKAGNSLILAHCTVPRTLVEDFKLRSHFESGLGIGIQGTLPNGDVTLIRIGGKDMEKIWIAEGEIISSGNSEKLCRTQVTVKLSNGGTVRDLLLSPLGNHIVLVYGHHLKRLEEWRENIKSIFGDQK